MPLPILLIALITVPWILTAASGSGLLGVIAAVLIIVINPVIWNVRKNQYFNSPEFQMVSSEVQEFVSEHNELVEYISELRLRGSFVLGASDTGQYSHLATFENTSDWNYKRDRNVADYSPNVHTASLQVVRKASAESIKYLMKYFGIKATKETLADVQHLAEDISRLEEAVSNVENREKSLASRINPPAFIMRRYASEFWQHIGVKLSPITVPYPVYKFQYTSPGGNSSQTSTIRLDTRTLDALSGVLSEKIKWAKSAAGQRALMTARLRGEIKERDNYTCQACGISVSKEPHLLIEVDHILPVSRGGLSTPDNLQALCWKCNRSKGAKIL